MAQQGKQMMMFAILFVLIACSLESNGLSAVQNVSFYNQSLSGGSDPSAVNNANNTIEDSSTQVDLEQFWLNQRDEFFNQTTFNLSKVSSRC